MILRFRNFNHDNQVFQKSMFLLMRIRFFDIVTFPLISFNYVVAWHWNIIKNIKILNLIRVKYFCRLILTITCILFNHVVKKNTCFCQKENILYFFYFLFVRIINLNIRIYTLIGNLQNLNLNFRIHENTEKIYLKKMNRVFFQCFVIRIILMYQ